MSVYIDQSVVPLVLSAVVDVLKIADRHWVNVWASLRMMFFIGLIPENSVMIVFPCDADRTQFLNQYSDKNTYLITQYDDVDMFWLTTKKDILSTLNWSLNFPLR